MTVFPNASKNIFEMLSRVVADASGYANRASTLHPNADEIISARHRASRNPNRTHASPKRSPEPIVA